MTIRALPDKDARFSGFETYQSSVWSNVVRDFMDAYQSDDDRGPRFQPTREDVSDCLTCLDWCSYLDRNEFRFIWWRSFGLSFGVIAGVIGRSDETARRYYSAALEKVCHAASFAA